MISIREKLPLRGLCLILAVGIPIALSLSWHSLNTVYPNDDAANYYETAQDIYLAYENGGLMDGIRAAYSLRGWRPLFFPVIAAPFIALAGGDVIQAVAMTLLFLYAVYLAYAYLLAREFVGPIPAILATLLLGTNAWVSKNAYHFFSEMALMAVSMAAIYHLKRSEFFAHKAHTVSLGAWLGLGMMVRPIETFFAFALLLPAVVFAAVRKKTVSLKDVAATLPFFLLTAGILVSTIFIPYGKAALWLVAGAGIIVSFLPVFFMRRWGLNRGYVAASVVCNLMVIFWWAPFFKAFYLWVKETTGIIGSYYHDKGEMGFFKAVYSFFKDLGGYQLLLAVLIFAAGLAATKADKKKILKDYAAYNAAALALIFLPVFMLSLTTDITYRRAYVGFSALLLSGFVFALHGSYLFARARFVFMAVLAAVQILHISLYAFDLDPALRGRLLPYLGAHAFPMRGGDPSERFLSKLKGLAIPKDARIVLYSNSLFYYQERPFEVSAVKVAARKYGFSPASFGHIFLGSLDEAYGLIRKQQWNYIALDVTTEKTVDNPYTRLTVDMTERWRSNRLDGVGLKPVAEFKTSPAWINERERPPDKTIVLLEVLDNINFMSNGVRSITASSNLFPKVEGFSERHLMEENATIWHASKPPKYPEWVEIAYVEPKKITSLALRAQDSSPNGDEFKRGPKDFALQGSNDKMRWNELLKVRNNVYKKGGEWKKWSFKNTKAYLYYRIHISASGNPELLTMRQIQLD